MYHTKNASVSLGDRVSIERSRSPNVRNWFFHRPKHESRVWTGDRGFRRGLNKRPVSGDRIFIRNDLFAEALPFQIVSTKPKGIAGPTFDGDRHQRRSR